MFQLPLREYDPT